MARLNQYHKSGSIDKRHGQVAPFGPGAPTQIYGSTSQFHSAPAGVTSMPGSTGWGTNQLPPVLLESARPATVGPRRSQSVDGDGARDSNVCFQIAPRPPCNLALSRAGNGCSGWASWISRREGYTNLFRKNR